MNSVACPVQTRLPHSCYENAHPGDVHPEIRAYKLGKKRWSYNQVELLLGEAGGSGRTAVVHHALHAGAAKFPEAHQESAVGFMVQLESGHKLQAHVYLCYDQQPAQLAAAAAAATDAEAAATKRQSSSPAAAAADGPHHAWQLVTRKHCCKGCEGPVVRSIQRFGRLGKRAWGADAPSSPEAPVDQAASPGAGVGSKKDPRCMYLSLDEACTHVGASAFRLVAGIYNRQGTRLLTTAVSAPIRVLANNDVPTGAARITLEASLPADWEGWGNSKSSSAKPAAALPGSDLQAALPSSRRARTPAKPRRRNKLVARSLAADLQRTDGQSSQQKQQDSSRPATGHQGTSDGPAYASAPGAPTHLQQQYGSEAARAQQWQLDACCHGGRGGGSSAASPASSCDQQQQRAKRSMMTGAHSMEFSSDESTTFFYLGGSPVAAQHPQQQHHPQHQQWLAAAARGAAAQGVEAWPACQHGGCFSAGSLQAPGAAAAADGCGYPQPPGHWLAPSRLPCGDLSLLPHGWAASSLPAAPAAAQPACSQQGEPCIDFLEGQREAERQLRLLQELKAQLQAACREVTSGGGGLGLPPQPSPAAAWQQQQCAPGPLDGLAQAWHAAPLGPHAPPPPSAAAAFLLPPHPPPRGGGSGSSGGMVLEDNLGLPLLDGCCNLDELHFMLPSHLSELGEFDICPLLL